MLWQLLLAIASLAFKESQNPVDPEVPYVATPYGPQSWEEAEQAAEALYGHGDDILYPENDGRSHAEIIGNDYRWPDNTIPIVVSKDISSNKTFLQLLDRVRYYIQNNTNIKIVPKRDHHQYWVSMIRDGSRCYSYVGCQRVPGQPLSLGEKCDYFGTVLHELLHAYGLGHEHNRYDRDDYITINSKNVKQGEIQNFKKDDPAKMDTLDIPYEYGSIMHYGNFAFSKDKKGGLRTLEALDGRVLKDPWEKSRMTAADIELVNSMSGN